MKVDPWDSLMDWMGDHGRKAEASMSPRMLPVLSG